MEMPQRMIGAFRVARRSSRTLPCQGRSRRTLRIIQIIPQRAQAGVRGDLALAGPQHQTADQNADHHDIKESPQDAQRHAAVITEMQRAGDFEKTQIRSEARAIGHGRADVAFDMGLVTIVAELKKVDRHRTLEELLFEHGMQATAYQRSNVRLGLLLVLDLVDRGGTGEHFSASSKLLEKTPPETTMSYSVAVIRIQGRKSTPSSIKKPARRKG